MRKRLLASLTLIAVLAAAWFITVAVFAEEKPAEDSAQCPYCGMNTGKSPTHVIATYAEKGKKAVQVDFQSIGCYMRMAMDGDNEGTYSDAKILDTSTFGAKKLRFIALRKAWYVPVKSLRGSMPPYFASFADKKVAAKYAREHESQVMSFKDAHKLVMKEISDDEDGDMHMGMMHRHGHMAGDNDHYGDCDMGCCDGH